VISAATKEDKTGATGTLLNTLSLGITTSAPVHGVESSRHFIGRPGGARRLRDRKPDQGVQLPPKLGSGANP